MRRVSNMRARKSNADSASASVSARWSNTAVSLIAEPARAESEPARAPDAPGRNPRSELDSDIASTVARWPQVPYPLHHRIDHGGPYLSGPVFAQPVAGVLHSVEAAARGR